MKMYVQTKTADGQEYYYVHVGSETHGRPTYIMWVKKSLLKADEQGKFYLELPLRGCDVKRGKKESTLILNHGSSNLYYFLIECGYRGSSHIDEISTDSEDVQVFYFDKYASERGSLGISQGVLVLTKAPKIKIKWRRSGRLYGKPSSGITILYVDGRQENLEDIEEEDLNELKEEV